MKWNVTLSGDHAACRAQLNTAVHALTTHSDENAAKRAVAHYVASEILDKAQAAHEAAQIINGKNASAKTLSVAIAIDVTAS